MVVVGSSPERTDGLPAPRRMGPIRFPKLEDAVPMAFTPEAGYAPFWKRAAAAVVDGILWTVAYYLVGAIAVLLVVLPGGSSYGTMSISIIGVFIGWLYNALMESSPWQATFGKMLLDIRVCDMNGDVISFRRATGRYFAKYVSTALLFLGFLLPLFRPNKQALHDRMARTLVVNRHPEVPRA
jgi:uncharacterized RDD family membrane protein YckC